MEAPVFNFTPIDHARARVGGDADVLMDVYQRLSFESPGAKYDPRVRRGQWDGLIHLIDRRSMSTYTGLQGRIKAICEERGYEFRPGLGRYTSAEPMTAEDAEAFVDTLGIPSKFERRDYQLEALAQAVRTGRQLFLSPTSSGKSMIIYTAVRWYRQKTLIVVPTVGLVHQMAGDFQDYGCPLSIHKIQDGRDNITADVTVATWQAIYKMPEEWFDQFGLVIGDEAHLFKAESLTAIMMKLKRCEFRFGFTGTLDGSKVHQLILEGLFGPTTKVTTTAELMDRKMVAQLKIEIVVLEHTHASKKALEAATAEALATNKKQKRGAVIYAQEIAHIYASVARNRFLTRLVTKLEGNTLLLFHHLAHGDALYDMVVSETSRPVHLINGGVAGLERDDIRSLIEASSDAILIASVGTSSTGISIRRINNMVMASPWKSRIVNLQSIGRSLRMAEDKTTTTYYDIADNLSFSPKTAPNNGLKHLGERMAIYDQEGFDYRVNWVDLP